MSSIIKVWLQFPSDSEESYTSLPCTPETTGRELGAKLASAIRKKRGMDIEIGTPHTHSAHTDSKTSELISQVRRRERATKQSSLIVLTWLAASAASLPLIQATNGRQLAPPPLIHCGAYLCASPECCSK